MAHILVANGVYRRGPYSEDASMSADGIPPLSNPLSLWMSYRKRGTPGATPTVSIKVARAGTLVRRAMEASFGPLTAFAALVLRP